MNQPDLPQIENETLGIHDRKKSTDGGPPGWFALAVVGGVFLSIAAVVFLVLFFVIR
ncbi:MAG: hypothetical protein AAF800_00020 [Planctomycetota bacterium]